ncbi:MAG: DUF1844 domain-containing protein [Phycisphaeraceae bacterium]
MTDEAPKIIVDDDWKAQAQAEKKKLAEQTRAKTEQKTPPLDAAAAAGTSANTSTSAGAKSSSGQLPPATFESLVSTMTTQALFAMGAIPDPATGQRIAHLDLARHHIDMLGVLEEKTKGNLTKEEEDLLASTLYELRNRYVQMVMANRPTAQA